MDRSNAVQVVAAVKTGGCGKSYHLLFLALSSPNRVIKMKPEDCLDIPLSL
jgi:hypothetical protein